MHKFISVATVFVASILAYLSFGFVNVAHAANSNTGTQVGGYLSGDTVWTPDNSPYVLTADVYVPDGHTLTVMPGVDIEPDPSNPDASINTSHGSIVIDGTPDNHVKIGPIGHFFVAYGSIRVNYAEMSTHGIALQVSYSKVSVSNTRICCTSGTAIYSRASTVTIDSSRIMNNGFAGVYVLADPSSPPFVIHNSAITGNSSYAILNRNSWAVDATNNWWGSESGPATSGSTNLVSGPVATKPWLTADPALAIDPKPCCSSVLFIPGLESTRLYRPEVSYVGVGIGIATSSNTLWEPNISSDVKKLYLKEDGTSIDHTIYSGAPIDKALGFVGIYDSFMKSLDKLVEGGSIREWKAFGYDWRKPIAEVVAGAEQKATTTESLLALVDAMAASSKTGKVSIVAHSNGGLVAKYLVKMLTDLGKQNLIDTVISVAVPYIGTPEAIAGLLHGEDQ